MFTIQLLSYRNEAMFYNYILPSPGLADRLMVPTPYAISCAIAEDGTFGDLEQSSACDTHTEQDNGRQTQGDTDNESNASDQQLLLLALQDISVQFPVVAEYRAMNLAQARAGIAWLAGFHTWSLEEDVVARLQSTLAQQGTYWYLDTRPDEFAALQAMNDADARLLAAAGPAVDHILKTASWQALVHGDFKAANLQFTKESKGEKECQVVAYDFQYVGRGSPMKDVAYMLRSSVELDVLAEHEGELVELYWSLRGNREGWSLEVAQQTYDLCVVDFCRFMVGWGRTSWGLERSSLAIDFACQVLEKCASGDNTDNVPWLDRLKLAFPGV
jgi:hypothetical protein